MISSATAGISNPHPRFHAGLHAGVRRPWPQLPRKRKSRKPPKGIGLSVDKSRGSTKMDGRHRKLRGAKGGVPNHRRRQLEVPRRSYIPGQTLPRRPHPPPRAPRAGCVHLCPTAASADDEHPIVAANFPRCCTRWDRLQRPSQTPSQRRHLVQRADVWALSLDRRGAREVASRSTEAAYLRTTKMPA